MYEVYGVNLPN